ncbi:transcriptional regulator [Thermomicrobium sp.]
MEAGWRILVVDDESWFREGMARALESWALVRGVDDLGEAQRLLGSWRPHAIIVDPVLRSGDAIAFLSRVAREENVVVFCCVARRGYPLAFRDGRVRFIPREWSWRTLSSIIEHSVRVLLDDQRRVQCNEASSRRGNGSPQDPGWSSQKWAWLTAASKSVVNSAEGGLR